MLDAVENDQADKAEQLVRQRVMASRSGIEQQTKGGNFTLDCVK